MSTPKISSAIVCEDIRIEGNGKHIIIGVYTNDMIVPSFPATIPFMVWMQIENINSTPSSFEFRASFNDNEFIKGSFDVSVSDGTRATIPLGQFPLTIDREGELRVDIRYVDTGRWKNAVKILVKRLPSPTS